jgi:hypothetical protein
MSNINNSQKAQLLRGKAFDYLEVSKQPVETSMSNSVKTTSACDAEKASADLENKPNQEPLLSSSKPRRFSPRMFGTQTGRPRQSLVSNLPLLRSKAEHLVLAGPFGWQVGQAGNSHPMREPPVDGGLDKIGREEGKRDCHIHLADAAPLSLGDAVRSCRLLGDKFIEPTAPAGDRCDQGGAIFRT